MFINPFRIHFKHKGENKVKRFIAFITVFLLFADNAMAFVHFYVYVKNETEHPLIINKKVHVRPDKQHILQSFAVSDNQFFQEILHLEGIVRVKKPALTLCRYNFDTYTILDSGNMEFKTFLIIKKVGDKYICTPIAGEVFPQGNSLKPQGMRLRINEALVRHEMWKRQIENTGKAPVFMLDPNVGIQETYKALIKRSH